MLREFTEHYEEARPHQGLGQRTPCPKGPAGALEADPTSYSENLLAEGIDLTDAAQCLAIFILRGASPWHGDLNGTPAPAGEVSRRLADDVVLLRKLEAESSRSASTTGPDTINIHSDKPFTRSLDRLDFASLRPGANRLTALRRRPVYGSSSAAGRLAEGEPGPTAQIGSQGTDS